MNTYYEYNTVIATDRHAEMIRQAEHARLVRTLRRNRKAQPNRFARMMHNITRRFAGVMQHRNARQVSGHAR